MKSANNDVIGFSNASTIYHSPILTVNQLSKSFQKKSALQEVSFSLNQGELIALLGPNGAGKTTLLNHLIGLYPVEQGSILINGFQPGTVNAKQQLGIMLQSSNMPNALTARENIELFSSYYPKPMELNSIIELVQIDAFVDQPFSELSGGQKQRVFFALAICGNPPILILDEPTVGMDTESRHAFWQVIDSLKEKGTSILLSTHYVDEADRLADKIILLQQGKILLQDSPSSIKKRLSAYAIEFDSQWSVEQINKTLQSINNSSAIKIARLGHRIQIVTTQELICLTQLLRSNVIEANLSVSPISLEEAILLFQQQIKFQNKKECAA